MGVLACAAALAWMAAVPVGAQTRPTCAEVISAVNRHVSERGGLHAGAVAVAERLKTDVPWVRRCMAAYGRRPAHVAALGDDDKERLDQSVEEGEPLPAPGAEVEAEEEKAPRGRSRRDDRKKAQGDSDWEERHGLVLHE